MLKFLQKIRRSLISKLLILIGLSLFLCVSVWAYFNIKYQKKKLMEGIVSSADTLTTTIKLGTHYSMMNNLRDDITQIITKVASGENIENIRIYNKEGQIKFSNLHGEVDQVTNIRDEACYVCHRSEPPLSQLSLAERTRIFPSPQGYRRLGILSPIYSEPGCSSNSCHFHPEGKQVLGALDVVVSLEEADREILLFQKWLLGFAVLIFLFTSTAVLFFILRFVKRPINNIMNETRLIANGEYYSRIEVDQEDEMGVLSRAINKMSSKIGEKQQELNKQRNEYQTLFERVPCIITVQDRDYRLIRYNREFSDKFNPRPGDYCYDAYKGRKEKCEICPVEQTFEDGRPHFSEERGFGKDGKPTHWIVNTAPIKNESGEVVAAMEMSLDVTRTKLLEEELKKSEKKYSAIFDNIPNPVFVLDMDTLEILDCNGSVKSVYGYKKKAIIRTSFLELFRKEDQNHYENLIRTSAEINQARQYSANGGLLFVNIRISPFDYLGGKALLVTTSDITKRLETEQQLIQASKMATLGEMATGVAHELNQPLAVIKTASRFFIRKIAKKEKIEDEILSTMATEIDSYVDRATKIINHMRQFGRQSDVSLEKIQVNSVLERALEILGQQLKVRGIEVVRDLTPDLPLILADPDRLEQVFINLLINARDAIDEKRQSQPQPNGEKRITLRTSTDDKVIIVEVIDTGPGIPESMLDRIFEPFFTTKKVGQGTGLGLSISYGIIKDCKGSIRAVSVKNKGAGFIVKFPIAREG
ncbi:MAG: ATP-binding protein [Desulfobacteraceae bacterium]|jgi:histidine kinase|nr:ATP-binding protein [Desulfobacteraceae bacterium]